MTRPAYDRASDPRLVIVGTTAGQISWTLTHSPGARAHYDRPCLGDDRRTSQKRLVFGDQRQADRGGGGRLARTAGTRPAGPFDGGNRRTA